MNENRYLFPDAKTAAKVSRETLVMRAAEAFKVFYPAVSMLAVYRTNVETLGGVPNQRHNLFAASPKQVALTANSDTPYAVMVFDMSEGR